MKLAELVLAGAVDDDAEPARTGGDRTTILVHLAKSALCEHHAAQLEDGTRVPAETLRRLCCDSGLVPVATDEEGRTLDVGRKTRRIPPAIRRALITRDKGCRFPGCQHTRWTDAHHILHWLDGGETKLSNLVLLCPHHHRLIHEEGYQMERAGADVLFRRPDGRILTLAPRAPLLPGWALAELRAANENAGAHIDEHTAESGWRGERIDYDHIVGVLM